MGKLLKTNLTTWHLLLIPTHFFIRSVSTDRWVHLWFAVFLAIIVAVGFWYINKRFDVVAKRLFVPGVARVHLLLMSAFTLFLGSWVPDLDWFFNVHRSPLTHSAIPFFICHLFLYRPMANDFSRILLLAFGIGLASHLVLDVLPGAGRIVGIPGLWGVVWLWGNAGVVAAACAGIAAKIQTVESIAASVVENSDI